MDNVKEATRLLIEHDSKQHAKKSPIISVDGCGKTSRLKICGIDVSRAIDAVSYSGSSSGYNRISVDINIPEMLEVISEISKEDMEKAREIILPYIKDKF